MKSKESFSPCSAAIIQGFSPFSYPTLVGFWGIHPQTAGEIGQTVLQSPLQAIGFINKEDTDMNHGILLENQKKRLDQPLWMLICFAMFNFWQMGFIYFVGVWLLN